MQNHGLRGIADLPLIMGDEPKGKPISFRPADGVKELLDLAQKATDEDITELILQCLRAQLPKIVEQAHVERTERRKKALEQFRKAAARLK